MLRLRFHGLVFRSLTFLVWAVAAASVVYWGLKLSAGPQTGGVAAVASNGVPQADPALVAKALGATKFEAPTAQFAPTSSRFSLLGMVAGVSTQGVALIAVDGKPAKPVRVGAKLEEGLVLQSVHPRSASLGAAMGLPALFTLELPVAK